MGKIECEETIYVSRSVRMIKMPWTRLSGLPVSCEELILRENVSFENCAGVYRTMCPLLKKDSALLYCTA